MEDDQQFCLRWNNHQATLIAVFDKLLENETLVDCTLAAEGKYLNAHKVVLSACSPYFESLLSQNYDKHPIFILKDVKYLELKAMMDYMYRGEVNISQDSLSGLLRAAESLQIKGLSDNRGGGGGGGGGGSSSSRSAGGTDEGPTQAKRQAQQQQQHAKLPNKGQGLTITEQRASRGAPKAVVEPPPLMQDDREGSTSPGPSRRRKRARRKSTDTEDNLNHHDGASNSSESHQSGNMMTTSATTTTNVKRTRGEEVPAPLIETKAELHHAIQEQKSNDQAAFSSCNANTATTTTTTPLLSSKQEPSTSSGQSTAAGGGNISQAEVMLEPKSEYIDDMNEDSIEDLTLDDDDLSNIDDGAGPSGQGGGESNQDPFIGLLQPTHRMSPPPTYATSIKRKPKLPRLIKAATTTTPINNATTTTSSRIIRKPKRYITETESQDSDDPEQLPDPLDPTLPVVIPILNTFALDSSTIQGAQYDVDMLMYGLSGSMRKYAPETVRWALDAILNRGASVTAASQASGIKRTSLHLYLKKLNIRKVKYDDSGWGGGDSHVLLEGVNLGETSGGLIIEQVIGDGLSRGLQERDG